MTRRRAEWRAGVLDDWMVLWGAGELAEWCGGMNGSAAGGLGGFDLLKDRVFDDWRDG